MQNEIITFPMAYKKGTRYLQRETNTYQGIFETQILASIDNFRIMKYECPWLFSDYSNKKDFSER